jgi:coenzyme F420-reducing hydrogenase alpha subunit
MTTKLILKKATRIEGNADIYIEFDKNRLKSARFQVLEFRGFEKFASGRRAEWVPHMISRICGLCSTAHQVAGVRAIENAIGLEVDERTRQFREIMVLGEWISSHSLSYFFLSSPDFMGAEGGIFALRKNYPETFDEAFAMRRTAMDLVQLFGKRNTHAVTLAPGRFLGTFDQAVLSKAKEKAASLKEKIPSVIAKVSDRWEPDREIEFPKDLKVHFVAYSDSRAENGFFVYNRSGQLVNRFTVDEFEEKIAEMRVDWSLSKIPYLEQLGFPEGIMLVGPLARSFLENGFLSDPEIRQFDISKTLLDSPVITLESYDVCRLLEMYWAAKRIETLLENIGAENTPPKPDWEAAGQGLGVLEAPRGLLIHKYRVNNGYVDKIRLLVATQFNNAFINLLITDLAQRHSLNGKLTETGNRLIGRCIRLLDPCLSCATH